MLELSKNYSLITLGWKSLDNIKAVYKEAEESTHKPKEIIVVNNYYNSTVGSEIESFLTKAPKTKYVLPYANIGIGLAWNLAMYMSSSQYCIIVNDDCRVGKNTYELMMREFEKEDMVGSVGVCWGENPQDKKPTPQGFLIGFNMKMILSIGGYKEFYNPFADERELCLRGWVSGWSSVVAPNCEYQHVHDISNNPEQEIPFMGKRIVPRRIQEKTEPTILQFINHYNCLL